MGSTCQYKKGGIPRKFQSAGRTAIRRNASFKSILLSKAPGPNLLIILYASSIIEQ